MKLFQLFKVAAFTALTLFAVDQVSEILVPVDYCKEETYTSGIAFFCSYYEEPKNTLDALYLGSSHIYSGISPVQIYENYGITGFDCATSSQNSYKSYHCLLEALKTQTPKVVVMDLMSMTMENGYDEIANLNFLGKLKFSRNFVEATLHEASMRDVLEYTFPALRFHDRWEELTRTDFTSRFFNDYAKLEDMRYGDRSYVSLTEDDFPQLTREATDAVIEPSQDAVEYIGKIADLCAKKNISLLLIKTPIAGYTPELGIAMQKFADSLNVPLIDYNQLFDEIGFDYTTDFLDTVHLNILGRTKVSAHLGDYLAAHYDIDTTPDPAWDAAVELYHRDCKANQLQAEKHGKKWLSLLQDDNYLILASGNLKRIGQKYRDTLALIHSPSELLQGESSGCKYHISSEKICVNGIEYACNPERLTMVVYDKILGQIVDHRTFKKKNHFA